MQTKDFRGNQTKTGPSGPHRVCDVCLLCDRREKPEEAAPQVLPHPRWPGTPDLHQHVPQLGAQRRHRRDHGDGAGLYDDGNRCVHEQPLSLGPYEHPKP